MLREILVALLFVGLAVAGDGTCSNGCVDTDGNCQKLYFSWRDISEDRQFCIGKKCASPGTVTTGRKLCYYEPNDQCIYAGGSISIGNCSAVECTQTDSNEQGVIMNVINRPRGCTDADGTCYEVGEQVRLISEDKQFCIDRKCHSAGTELTERFKCYYEPKGRCVYVGQTLPTGACSAVLCSNTDSNVQGVILQEVSNGCKDSLGTCQPEGGPNFPAIVGGVGQSNCSCTASENDGVTVYQTNCTNE